MQRTLYDAELPLGLTAKAREARRVAIAEQYPAAEVTLVEHVPTRGKRAYRVVAQLPAPKGSR